MKKTASLIVLTLFLISIVPMVVAQTEDRICNIGATEVKTIASEPIEKPTLTARQVNAV